MFNFIKNLNKKLTDRIIGKLAPYSISFKNCKLDWYKFDSIKKERGVISEDYTFGIPVSYGGQLKSDVFFNIKIIKIDANNTVYSGLKGLVNDNSSSLDKLLEEDFFISTYVQDHKDYIAETRGKLLNTDLFISIKNKFPILKITSQRNNDISKDDWYYETYFIFCTSFLIELGFCLTDINDSQKPLFLYDINKIIESFKYDEK